MLYFFGGAIEKNVLLPTCLSFRNHIPSLMLLKQSVGLRRIFVLIPEEFVTSDNKDMVLLTGFLL